MSTKLERQRTKHTNHHKTQRIIAKKSKTKQQKKTKKRIKNVFKTSMGLGICELRLGEPLKRGDFVERGELCVLISPIKSIGGAVKVSVRRPPSPGIPRLRRSFFLLKPGAAIICADSCFTKAGLLKLLRYAGLFNTLPYFAIASAGVAIGPYTSRDDLESSLPSTKGAGNFFCKQN